MRGRIVVLGWGSLIWEPGSLAPHVDAPWRMGEGPVLPLEFSRVSGKRRGALTLVIDADHGAPCPTSAIPSRRSDVAAAIRDLAAREEAPETGVGFATADGRARGAGADRVGAWLAQSGAAAAVWTDLSANFLERTGRPFSIEAARDHLRGLTGDAAAEARAYVVNAPLQTDTPLRRALAAEGWA